MANTIHDAMASAGLHPHKAFDLCADGKLVRFRLTGDKPGSRNGWAVLHDGPAQFGAFGSWKTSESHTWSGGRAAPASPAEQAAMQAHRAATKKAYQDERRTVQEVARTKAAKMWRAARPANSLHPYLQRKGIKPYGLRQLRDMLLVPMRCVRGELHSLQMIYPDGTKLFLTGGRTAGCYFAIGKPIGSLLVAEGLATAISLYEATGRAVAVCFSCGNMDAVARGLRSKFPQLKMVLCADDDFKTPGNPGVTAARAAAKAVGGYVAIPEFKRGAAT